MLGIFNWIKRKELKKIAEMQTIIDDLRVDVIALQQQCNDLEKERDDRENAIIDLDSKIYDLENQIEFLEKDNYRLENEIDEYKKLEQYVKELEFEKEMGYY